MLTSAILSYAYFQEYFIAWYSQNPWEWEIFRWRAVGDYAWAFWLMVFCNCIAPIPWYFKKMRTNWWSLFIIAGLINVGMWFERFVIIVTSLHRDYLPSSWSMFSPTFVDIGIYIGTIGFFMVLFLLYSRTFPVIAQAELKTILKSSSDTYKNKK